MISKIIFCSVQKMNPKILKLQILLIPIIIILNVNHVSSANILVFQAVGSHSTRISMWPLMEALAERGHNVSFLSAFPDEKVKNSKITQIVPKKLKEILGADAWENEENQPFFELRKDPWNIVKLAFELREHCIFTCEMLYSDPEIVEWIKSKETKFDLVIPEAGWNHCAYGLAHYWNAKLVVYGTTTYLPYMNEAFGFPDESSYVGELMLRYPTSKDLTFSQRFLNAFAPIIYTWTRDWSYLPRLEEITKKGLGLEDNELPKFSDIERNTSLILLSTHYSFGTTRSFPPNVISVGGTVISKQVEPLPKDMEQFIQSAKDGFIYISFGTVTEFTNFDDEVQKEFIAGIRNFPEIKFVWKSTYPIKHPLPENVFVAKWAPQQSLLAHPKIKAFITHAGMGSTLEAIHFQVPLICLPILADQNLNADLIPERGAGITLEILTLKRKELKGAIEEILYNQNYRKNMRRLSALFKDRPRPALEESVWWIEYAIRHDNLHEILMPASVHQPWWKKRQIDVWLTAAFLLLLVITLPLFFIKKLCNRSVGSKTKVKRN